MKLFHISAWDALAQAKEGDEFTLIGGPQHAEGPGVYFSAGEAVPPTTAEGTRVTGISAIVVLDATTPTGWWRTAPRIVRKFGRPATWHSDGKAVQCRVTRREGREIYCEWAFA